jgi:hypothetical protein
MATVRIDPKLHATLRALSDVEQRSMSQIIEDAVERYQQAKFWQAMRDGFARLRADPIAWSEYQAESSLWDSASGDGLEEDEPYFSAEEARERGDNKPSRPGREGLHDQPVSGRQADAYVANGHVSPASSRAERS